jgi:DNA-binding HxlR family transcriptional regulator
MALGSQKETGMAEQDQIFKGECANRLLDDRQVFGANCASRLLLDQIGDKWSMLVIAALDAGPLRFNAIKRRLDGVTQKALTQSLRRLERNGIIARRVVPVPIAVEYRITPLGRTLDQFFLALYSWTKAHLPEVEQARQDFDRRAAI